jgi:hypothetical protein
VYPEMPGELPHGEQAAYRGEGPTMQRAWEEVRAQLGHRKPKGHHHHREQQPQGTRGPGRQRRAVPGGAALRRMAVRPRPPHTARQQEPQADGNLPDPRPGPVADGRANGQARFQLRDGGDWAAFVAVAEQLTDDGWQPIEVDFPGTE